MSASVAGQLLIGLFFASIISLFSYFTRLLTPGGAFVQFILGTVFLGLGGWKWTVPMLVFFILSSILSRIGKSRKASAETFYEKFSRRDAGQVLANGGVAGGIVFLGHFVEIELLYVAYLGAVAAATSDTWGTEIGTLSRSSPVLLTTLKRVESGRSGAVSVLGTVAGIAGSVVIWISALWWIPGKGFVWLISVVFGGIFGSLVDSFLGATLQAQYRCVVCGKVTEHREHCNSRAALTRGLSRMNNDAVNLICTLAGFFGAGLLFRILD